MVSIDLSFAFLMPRMLQFQMKLEVTPWFQQQESRMDKRINPRLTESVSGAG